MKQLSDMTEAATPVRKLLERDVQKKCVEWARARGYWARKFSSQSQRSVPDYLFAREHLIFAIEFKAPGKVSTDAQVEEQQVMIDAGWFVYEIDDFKRFKEVVFALEAL